MRSLSATELDDAAAVTLRGAIIWCWFVEMGVLALFCDFLAEFAAGVGFAVEGLSYGGWATDFAEVEDFHLEVATVIGYLQHVADADFARRLRWSSVEEYPTEIAGF
jgi:hypothetical protein